MFVFFGPARKILNEFKFFFTASLFPVFVCVHGFEQSKKKKKLLKLFFFFFLSFHLVSVRFCFVATGPFQMQNVSISFSFFFSYKLNFDCRSNATCFFVVVCFACGSCGLLISWRKTKKSVSGDWGEVEENDFWGHFRLFPFRPFEWKIFFVRQCRVVKSQRINSKKEKKNGRLKQNQEGKVED